MSEGVNGVINAERRINGGAVIRPTMENTAAQLLNHTSPYTSLQGSFAERVIDNAARSVAYDDSIGSQASEIRLQNAAVAPLMTASAVGGGAMAATKTMIKNAKINKSVAKGVLSSSEAKGIIKSNKLGAVKGVAKNVFSAPKQALTKQLDAIGKNSDDLGIQAAATYKDAYYTTKSAIGGVKGTYKAIKKTVTVTKKVVNKTIEVFKSVGNFLAKPKNWKLVGLIGVVLLFMSVATAVFGAVSYTSYKGNEKEVSLTWELITKKDYDFKKQIEKSGAEEIYLNGSKVSSADSITIYTDAEAFICYFEVLYGGDYNCNYVLFGTKPYVSDDVDEIYDKLCNMSKERVREDIKYVDSSGNTRTQAAYTNRLYVNVVGFDYWLSKNYGSYLTEEQYEQYQLLYDSKGMLNLNILAASPFKDNWRADHYVGRYGYREHPIDGSENNHQGIDIAYPSGTPIYAATAGTAVCKDSGSEGYGLHILVQKDNKNYTLYGHCSALAVTDGQAIKIGDLIGYVGTTGTSTGNHLHFELVRDGHKLNPLLYTACNE